MTIEDQIERMQSIIDVLLPHHYAAAGRLSSDLNNDELGDAFRYWDARTLPLVEALAKLHKLRETT